MFRTPLCAMAVSLFPLCLTPPARSELVAYWSFNTANLGEDTGGLANNLTAVNSPTFNPAGKFGGAITLNGTNQYLTTPTGLTLNGIPLGNNPYTIAAWFKPTATGNRGILGYGNYGSVRQVNGLRLLGINGFRHFWSGSDLDANPTSNFSNGQWHHLAATFDGTNRTIFFNGVQVATDVPLAHAVPNSNNFRIGSTNFGEYFSGSLDDVAVWNNALSQPEIQQLVSGISPRAGPYINSFTVDKTTAFEGEAVKLSWTVDQTNISGAFSYQIKYGTNVLSTGTAATGTFNTSVPDLLGINGPATWTLRAIETGGTNVTKTATASLTGNPGIPTAFPRTGLNVMATTGLPIALTGTDPNGGTLSYSIVTPPTKGTLSGLPPNITYNAGGLTGSDQFTFKVNDGKYDSPPASVSIVVLPAPTAPTSVGLEQTTIASENVDGNFVSIITAVDVNAGEAHTFSLVSGPGSEENSHFTVSGNQLAAGVSFAGFTGQPQRIRLRATDSQGLFVEGNFVLTVAPGIVNVVLNEFVASTDNDDPRRYCDIDGSPEDWIELHNIGGSQVNIGGCFLTDSSKNLTKWKFPGPTLIAPGGFLIVFASNKDRAVSGQQLHTNFKLSDTGEYLALVQPDGVTVIKEFKPAYPVVPEYWSYGLKLPAASRTYAPFQIPTPGAANTTFAGFPAGDVNFSIASQTFTASAISLTLSTPSPTAQIRYTTNRTDPSTGSTLYSGPLSINTTTMIRARAYETAPGFAPGLIRSETYLKLGTASGTFTSNLPVVVLNNFGGGRPDADSAMFWTLFTPSVTTGNRTTLTSNPAIATRGRMVARGSSSAGWPKYSLNIEALDEFNVDTPVAPLGLAPEADWVLQSNYDFDRGMIRNAYMYELSNRIGRWAPRGRFVEVFSNTDDGTVDYPGDYMGVYTLMDKPERGADRINVERLDKNDLAGNDVTGGYIIKIDRTDPGTVGWSTNLGIPAGARLNYVYPEELPSPAPIIPAQQSAYIRNYVQEFEDAIVRPNFTNATTGLHYTSYIDRDSWVDHALLNILAENVDCFRLSSYMHKAQGGKLMAGPIWDFDRTINSASDSRSADPFRWFGASDSTDVFHYGWWNYLWTDPDFYQRYVDRWTELRAGLLSDANLTGLVTQYEGELTEAAVRNYAKWTSTPPRDGPDADSTGSLKDEMDIVRLWMTQHAGWIDTQFLAKPARTPAGGQSATVRLTAAQGTIYYTLDGTDPRAAGGSIKPGALAIASGNSVNITSSSLLVARAKTTTQWSAPSSGYYFTGTPASAANVVISEIQYHPPPATVGEQLAGFTDKDDFEFIELMNISSGSIDLSGAQFVAGINFTMPRGSIVPAGGRIVIASNAAAFASRYPDIFPAGAYAGDRLDNAGERITLLSVTGTTIADFTYGPGPPWPTEADGFGPSLVLIDPLASPNPALPASWRASDEYRGSPLAGEAYSFAAWSLQMGTLASETLDSDSDGVANLLEFAFGTNAFHGGSGPPALRYTGTLAGNGSIALLGQPAILFEKSGGVTTTRAVFVRRKDYLESGLTYAPEFSTYLEIWIPSTETPTVLADNGTYQIVSVPFPNIVSRRKSRFFRVAVTAPLE